MVEGRFQTCIAQDGSLQAHTAAEHVKCGCTTKALPSSFYFTLTGFSFKSNSYTRTVDSIALDDVAVKQEAGISRLQDASLAAAPILHVHC